MGENKNKFFFLLIVKRSSKTREIQRKPNIKHRSTPLKNTEHHEFNGNWRLTTTTENKKRHVKGMSRNQMLNALVTKCMWASNAFKIDASLPIILTVHLKSSSDAPHPIITTITYTRSISQLTCMNVVEQTQTVIWKPRIREEKKSSKHIWSKAQEFTKKQQQQIHYKSGVIFVHFQKV